MYKCCNSKFIAISTHSTQVQIQAQMQIQIQIQRISFTCLQHIFIFCHINIFIIFQAGDCGGESAEQGAGSPILEIVKSLEIFSTRPRGGGSLLTNLPIHSGLKTFPSCLLPLPGHFSARKHGVLLLVQTESRDSKKKKLSEASCVGAFCFQRHLTLKK